MLQDRGDRVLMQGRLYMTGVLLGLLPALLLAQSVQAPDARVIMEKAQHNLNPYRYLYEELSIILTDELGNRDTRQVRRFIRSNHDHASHFLMVFDSPDEYHGVALLAEEQQGRETQVSLYLPAFGEIINHNSILEAGETLFGTDFSVQDLTGELLADFQFIRREDQKIENNNYYVIDVYAAGVDAGEAYPLMVHYVRHESFYITRTNYLDKYGRVAKQLTLHDLEPEGNEGLVAGMWLMKDFRRNHSTLIKVDRRIASSSYVSDDVFTYNWLLENQPPLDLEHADDNELESELLGAGQAPEEQAMIVLPLGGQ